jgi:hypothetical protein
MCSVCRFRTKREFVTKDAMDAIKKEEKGKE